MTWIGVSGLRHPDDVALCAGVGVDAMGFLVGFPGRVPWNLTLVRAAMEAVRPHGVDVISGVERADHRKSPEQVAAFVAAVRAADGPRLVLPDPLPDAGGAGPHRR